MQQCREMNREYADSGTVKVMVSLLTKWAEIVVIFLICNIKEYSFLKKC